MKRKYWEILQAMPAAELAQIARRFEELELDGVWAPQIHFPPFPTLAALAACSTRLKLGTGIALAFTRSAAETALNALDIDRISGGRMVLGLGTSVRVWNENVHGVEYGKPVRHLREVVTTVRAIIEKGHTGELGAIDGRYQKLDLRGFRTARPPQRGSIPIYVPALFENTVALAAEVADGLLGHPVWSERWIAEQSNALENKLKAAARSREKFHVNLWNYAAVAPTRKQAIDDMRGTVAFYASIAQYARYYEAHGYGAQARSCVEAAQRNDSAAMLRAVPDEMVTTFAIAGTPDEARERVARIWPYADSMTLSAPQYFVSGARVSEYRNAIVSTFYVE
ncbi:MAG TPA: LLM class flavin-dependent oxidoreductase [Candidatus Acidoferrales bacterium]|nr:LLM class flavin-dependent oxidoreductase [Candidatus Acidoferrales bacterium]